MAGLGSELLFIAVESNAATHCCDQGMMKALNKTHLKRIKICYDPGKVDSNFFCYAATVFSPHRNVLIFTQRMHKPA